jgi:hypothetical protein
MTRESSSSESSRESQSDTDAESDFEAVRNVRSPTESSRRARAD